jgi:formylglycine-generating enzyme required for sulfatase activity
MLSAISITIGFFALIFSGEEKLPQPIYEAPLAKIKNIAVVIEEKKPEEINANNTPKKVMVPTLKAKEKTVVFSVTTVDSVKPILAIQTPQKFQKKKTISPKFALPILTSEEIEAHQKEKKKMLKMWRKKSSKICVEVPSGSFDFKGTKMEMNSFYMQRGEVSNIEYRTFINDLILEGRTKDFQIAIPKQSNWSEKEGAEFDWLKELEGKYSVDSYYDVFPVNNVSRAAVNMYCIWLQNQLNKTINKEVTIRLPYNYEWIYAGTEGGMKKHYSWGWDQVFNQHGCYVANFWINDRELPSFTDCEILGKDAFSSFWWRTGKRIPTSPVTYYWPNKWGLLDMNGNVAEMVNYKDQTIKYGALGGGWLSNADEIKFNAPDPYIGLTEPHLNIGFRVVME